MKEGLEHADHGAQPNVVGHHGDLAEIVPMLHSEYAVVPQSLKLKAYELLPDDVKEPNRTSIIASALGTSVPR